MKGPTDKSNQTGFRSKEESGNPLPWQDAPLNNASTARRREKSERIELASVGLFQVSFAELTFRIDAALGTFSGLMGQGESLTQRLSGFDEHEQLQKYFLKIRKDCETVATIAEMMEEFTKLIINAVTEGQAFEKDVFSNIGASPSGADTSLSE